MGYIRVKNIFISYPMKRVKQSIFLIISTQSNFTEYSYNYLQIMTKLSEYTRKNVSISNVRSSRI